MARLAPTLLRSTFLCLLALGATAHADVLQKCQQTEIEPASLRICVEAERSRAANQLRDLNPQALQAVQKRAKESGNRDLLRQFRAKQAQHVRQRKALCRKQSEHNAQVACEADMDNAHITQLQRSIQQ